MMNIIREVGKQKSSQLNKLNVSILGECKAFVGERMRTDRGRLMTYKHTYKQTESALSSLVWARCARPNTRRMQSICGRAQRAEEARPATFAR